MPGPLSRAALAAALLLAPTMPAVADQDFLRAFQADLYSGQIAKAEALSTARLATASDDAQAQFGLGTAQFLGAVEHLVQGLHHYGLRSTYERWGLGLLPILRLPVPDNPNPEPITYEALRDVLARFVDDLATADRTLAGVRGEVSLPLNIGGIRLDLNEDGTVTGQERLADIVLKITGLRTMPMGLDMMDVGFDSADVLWLRAYCNLLMAIADFPLGYDFHEAYDATFRGIFPNGNFPSSKIADNQEAIIAKLRELGTVKSFSYSSDSQKYSDWLQTEDGKRFQQAQDLQWKLDSGGVLDLLAFIHLTHWPVADGDRLMDVLGHLEKMVALSRASWNSILAETDDNREWIPNPKQQGVLPGMRITPETVSGWMSLLDELDGILGGRILLPHPRFIEGINVRRMLLDPDVFDPVLMLQGSGVERYLEAGPVPDPAVWIRLMQLSQGNFLAYFLWIN